MQLIGCRREMFMINIVTLGGGGMVCDYVDSNGACGFKHSFEIQTCFDNVIIMLLCTQRKY